MAAPTPRHCRPEAWDALQSALPRVDHTSGLIACAVAVAQHHLPDADAAATERALDQLAHAAAERLQSDRPAALLAHVHAVLFDEARFSGPADGDYYHPDHSLLPRVLDTRRGLPLTLVLVYKAVVERLGLPVRGVNAPGHFLAAVYGADAESTAAARAGHAPPARTLIDPFHGGRLLSRDDAFELVERVAGGAVAHHDALLANATHRQWLARLIQNLVTAADRRGHTDDLAAMLELRALVDHAPPGA